MKPFLGWPVICADPPWTFKDKGTRLAPSYSGEQRKSDAPYQVMSLDALLAMGVSVKAVAAPDAFLFLWAPGAMVLDGTALAVAQAWGFTPKQILPWIKTTASGKPRFGGGHYSRLCTEYLLLCTRGRPNVLTHAEPDVLFAQRGEHSAKPDESYRKIERLAAGPYLELFARRRFSPRWTCWGNEAPAAEARSA